MAAPGGNWQAGLAARLGVPLTPEVSRYFNAWAQAEGGGAANNPFNTTMPGYGATGTYNSVGVRNYATPQQGLDATAATLLNGKYGGIISALKQGKDARQMALALANSPWGTGALVLKVLGGGGLGQGASVLPQPPGPSPANVAQLPTVPQPTTVDPLGPQGAKLRSAFALSAPTTDANSAIAGLGGMAARARQAASADIPLPEPIHMPHAASGGTVQFQPLHGVHQDPQEFQAATLVQKFVGTPYVWGGAKPGGFDCSGLVQYVNGKVGISVPRTSYAQWDAGTPVKRGQLQPGDAVFFTGSDPSHGKPGHEGMYIGNGKFVEAPHTGAKVQVSLLAGRKDYVGARRFG
jgi:cell wall-associated NlpC family hydrolase